MLTVFIVYRDPLFLVVERTGKDKGANVHVLKHYYIPVE